MMRCRATTLVALGLCVQGCAQESYRMYAEGPVSYTVLRGQEVYLQVDIAAWGPNWRWFGFGGEAGVDEEGRRTFEQTTRAGGTDSEVALEHTAWQDGERSVGLSYEFHAPQSAELTQICVSVRPRSRFFRGGTCVARLTGGEENQVALPFGRGSTGDSVEALVLRDQAGGETVLTIDPARPVSMDGDGRIQVVGDSLDAGEVRSTEIAVSLPGAVTFFANDAETRRRSDTSDWFPYPVGPSGVPIDLSFLNRDEEGEFIPAGSHGFLVVDGDRFVFEDGTPARFWGLNVTAGAALGSAERAEQLAQRLARLGVNLVRFHHLDSWANPIVDYDHPDGTTQHLNADSMALLDSAIFELKQRGIYVVLDPWVQRCFTEADGVVDYGAVGQRGNFNLHPYIYFDARMQELIHKQWEQVWTHVNHWTGLAYKDDPAIVMTETINEGLLSGLSGVNGEYYRNQVEALYRAWAEGNDGLPLEQAKILTQNYGENNLRFFTHLHRSFYRESHDFLRSIGVRIPINATNWGHFTWIMAAQTDLDFMDSHHYYGGDQIGPGSGLGGLWLSHPPGLPGTPFGKVAGFAVSGKPVVSSECGNSPPKTYRAAYQIGLAAMAAFQEWDSITGYAYSQSGSPRDTLSAYEWEADPASVASVALGALIYRRGDVSPARQTVNMQIPEDEVWVLRWENDGEKQYWNTAGFNVAVEEHKFVVSLPDQGIGASDPAETLTAEDAFAYEHPDTEIRSDTGELWRDWARGVGTIDTPRTQVAYGRLGDSDRAWETSNCAFDIATPFAVVALSSLTDDAIAQSPRLLLSAVARAENTDQASNMARTRIVERGTAPVIAEPVVGTVRFRTSLESPMLFPVKVDGTRGLGLPVAAEDGIATVELRTEHQTIFYEIARAQ